MRQEFKAYLRGNLTKLKISLFPLCLARLKGYERNYSFRFESMVTRPQISVLGQQKKYNFFSHYLKPFPVGVIRQTGLTIDIFLLMETWNMNTRQTQLCVYLILLLWKSTRRGAITPVVHHSCTNPTLSSILFSLDPIELLPLSLARSVEAEHQTNNKTWGLGLRVAPVFLLHILKVQWSD